MPEYTFEVPKIFEPLAEAIRGISFFVGLGTNAANDPRFREYRLPGPGEMRFIPDLSEEELQSQKAAFGRWILKNGLRELVETYEVSLDRLYAECNRFFSILGKAAVVPEGRPFDRRHLNAKLGVLRDGFGIITDSEVELRSLMQARHCLSHRQGIVGKEDCDDTDSFVLKFQKLRVFVKQPSGEELEMRDVIEQKILLRDGGQIMLQLQKFEKPFPIGSQIALSPDEIQDVLWTIYRSATVLREKFEAFITSEVETHNSKLKK